MFTTSISNLKKKLLDIKHNRVAMGQGLGVEHIDEYMRFKRGAFNVCTGHANTGKTTVILYLMLCYAERHGIKWLIYSSENTETSIARKLIEFRTSKPIQKLTDQELFAQFEWLDEHFKIFSTEKLYTARTLLKDAAEVFLKWKYDGLLIDPYNSLVLDSRGKNEHSYHYEIASEMRLFCKQNDITIWLNTHAVTEALRRTHSGDHEYSGLPKPPSMADVEGGGKWGNRADDVITIHRYTQHQHEWNISQLHVRKVKEVETGGKPTPIDSPICLKMLPGNAGFTCAGIDVMQVARAKNNNLRKINF